MDACASLYPADGLIELTLRAIDGVFWTYEQKKILHFKTMFLQEINRKTMSLSYHQIEDPQIMDDRQKAMEIFYPGKPISWM